MKLVAKRNLFKLAERHDTEPEEVLMLALSYLKTEMTALKGRRFSRIRMTQTESHNAEFQKWTLRNISKGGAIAGFAV